MPPTAAAPLQRTAPQATTTGADCPDWPPLCVSLSHSCLHPFPTAACKLGLTAATALSHCCLLPQGYYQQLMCGQLTVKIPVQPAKDKKRRGAGNARDSTAAAAAAGGSGAGAAAAAATAAAEQRGWADDDDDDAVMAAILAENDCYENDTLHDGFDAGFSPQQEQQQQDSKPRSGKAAGAGAGKQQPAVSARKRPRKEAAAGTPAAAAAGPAPAVRPPKPQTAKVPEAQVRLLEELEAVA